MIGLTAILVVSTLVGVSQFGIQHILPCDLAMSCNRTGGLGVRYIKAWHNLFLIKMCMIFMMHVNHMKVS